VSTKTGADHIFDINSDNLYENLQKNISLISDRTLNLMSNYYLFSAERAQSITPYLLKDMELWANLETENAFGKIRLAHTYVCNNKVKSGAGLYKAAKKQTESLVDIDSVKPIMTQYHLNIARKSADEETIDVFRQALTHD